MMSTGQNMSHIGKIMTASPCYGITVDVGMLMDIIRIMGMVLEMAMEKGRVMEKVVIDLISYSYKSPDR